MKRTWTVALALVILSWAGAGAEQVFRWTDDSGRMHFSNVGPTDRDMPRNEETAQAAEAAMETSSATAATASQAKNEKESPYANLSEESFSSVASRKRAELKRQLDGAKKELRSIDGELTSLKQTRDRTFEQYGQQLQGVTRPEPRLSEREEELLEERQKVEKRIESIRASYDEMKEEAGKRHGSVPGWWLPLD